MMYKHVIDECIERETRSRNICLQYGRLEEAQHYQNKIDSLRRLREEAPEAQYQATIEKRKRKTFEELLREASPYAGERL